MAGFHSIPIRRFREFPGHDLRTLQVNSYDGTSEHVYLDTRNITLSVNMYAEFILHSYKARGDGT